MYEFFEDEKRYYLVTEYVLYQNNLYLGFAKEENSLTRSLQEENSQKKMQQSL